MITHPIWIGASECGGGDYYKANGKIYRSKIYERGVLVKEYIPAKRVSDGKKGLYEKVNKEFIVSAFTPVYHGEEERAEKIYKSGTYSNVELKLGIEYATIRFKKETEPNIILATQYVAKNVETYVDRVEVAGMEIGKQEWLAPAVENENVNTIWVFYEASRNNIMRQREEDEKRRQKEERARRRHEKILNGLRQTIQEELLGKLEWTEESIENVFNINGY